MKEIYVANKFFYVVKKLIWKKIPNKFLFSVREIFRILQKKEDFSEFYMTLKRQMLNLISWYTENLKDAEELK